MQTNTIVPQFVTNPSANTVHNFIAYRPAILESINALGPTVNLKSNIEQEQLMKQAEEDDSQE